MQEEDIDVLRKRMERATNKTSGAFTRSQKRAARHLHFEEWEEEEKRKLIKLMEEPAEPVKYQTIKLCETVSAVIQQHKLPPKLGDPGNFTIPCTIERTNFREVMLDLGSSINVMPDYLYYRLPIGPLYKTDIRLLMADNSYSYPMGVIKDVIVHVNHLRFPADFFVVKMNEVPSEHCSMLLGRPFMRTARVKIDVYYGTLSLAIDDDRIHFDPCKLSITT